MTIEMLGQEPQDDEPMHMTLCEAAHLVPRPWQTYIFVHIPGCDDCDRIAAQQIEAYGGKSPTPNEDGSSMKEAP